MSHDAAPLDHPLTVAETADVLGIHRSTVYRDLAREGRDLRAERHQRVAQALAALEGSDPATVAAAAGVSVRTVRRWRANGGWRG